MEHREDQPIEGVHVLAVVRHLLSRVYLLLALTVPGQVQVEAQAAVLAHAIDRSGLAGVEVAVVVPVQRYEEHAVVAFEDLLRGVAVVRVPV